MNVITSNGLQKFEVTFASGASVDTELPAAAALADNTATPTAPAVGAFLMVYDGATWDMARGTSANGLTVSFPSAQAVTVGGTVAVDSELPAAAALADNTATPTAPAVGAFLMAYDGATWDMVRGDSANGLTVNSELPAAAALGDNAGNPTAPAVGAFLMAYDGTDWDRARGDSTKGILTYGYGSTFTGTDSSTAANTAFGDTGDLGTSVKGATIGIRQSGAAVDAKTVTIEACYDASGTNWYKTGSVAFAAAADSASVTVGAARRYRFKSSTLLAGNNTVGWDGIYHLH
jgi:hypothetical protein